MNSANRNNYKVWEECLSCPINLHCLGEADVTHHAHKYCLNCEEWLLVSETSELRVHRNCRFVATSSNWVEAKKCGLGTFVEDYISGLNHNSENLVVRLSMDLCEDCTQRALANIEGRIMAKEESTL